MDSSNSSTRRPVSHRNQRSIMPRILTQRELNDVDSFIASKVEYWNMALDLSDVMRKQYNRGYARRRRQKLEDEGRFLVVGQLLSDFLNVPLKRTVTDFLLRGDPNPRDWRSRFTNISSATALSEDLTLEKFRGNNVWPDHVALFALKEIGRVLSDARYSRGIPEPCESETLVYEYLNNVDPLEPIAPYETDIFNLGLLRVSDTMKIELMDNPEGIENVLFARGEEFFSIHDWSVTEEEDFWVLRVRGRRGVLRLDRQSFGDFLSSSHFVLQ
ncbi:hypothetical protein SCHPADRAFT_994621 [Schizopora paradoxa]|uniref:Uncharacterized protein n=1 Tax=Schizopora paradoxa TaxID=27342 RepID=A0A0H2RYJ8_9AGAM|nr:hypothetical protein SCHPADRAFT_994621 [Schizopora paradoxa]